MIFLSMNFLVTELPIQDENSHESTSILSRLMHEFGVLHENSKVTEKEPGNIPRLMTQNERNDNNTVLRGINAKIIDSEEDSVDNNVSNIDNMDDFGSHSDFTNQKNGPDSLYDTLKEEDTNTITQIELTVDSWDINRNKWAKTGASPYLDNQTTPSVNEVHAVGNAVGSKNGDEMGDFGFQDINIHGTITSVKLRVYGKANSDYPMDGYFSVHLWNGSIWSEVMDFSGEANLTWKEIDISAIIDTELKINQTKIFLRTEDPTANKYGEHQCNMAVLQIDIIPTPKYELDLEAQWTSAEFTKPYAELAIYTGSCGTESLKVEVWNDSWITVIPNLIANSWNNISVQNYLTSSTFTIRFKGSNESSDLSQDQWNIDITLLNSWDNDETPPEINNFGIDDLGTGVGIFWANITDSQSNVNEVTLEVNTSQYTMTYNGSGFWTKQLIVEFNQTYTFSIENTSDTADNYITSPSEIKNHTFSYDSTIPNVDDWEYYSNLAYNGTFKANVSDSWGEIDVVIVNVTEVDGIPKNNLWAVMSPTASEYINDTIFIGQNLFLKFTVIVNDTSGNTFTSLEHTGTGPNHPPEASNLILTMNPRSNETLSANWTFYDIDGNNESSNWIIHWYKNGILQPMFENAKVIPSTATLKGQSWNYTLQVSDGIDYSQQYKSSITTIQNTPAEVTDINITPFPTSSDELRAEWISIDIDGDFPDDFIDVTIIRWYRWTGTWTQIPELENATYVTPGNLTRGEIYRFEVQLFDGEEYSNPYISLNTTILNSIPVLANVPSFNKTEDVTTSDFINITYNYDDRDGDSEHTTERIVYWYLNGILNSSKTNDTVLLSLETTSGETWQYVIRVYDGYNYSSNYTSGILSIGAYVNTLPEAQNLELIGDTNTTIEDLIASYSYFDADGHQEVQKNVLWYKNGILQPNLNNSLIVDSSFTGKNQIWNYTLSVYDGLNWSVIYNSPQIEIQNSSPELDNLVYTSNTTTIYNLTVDWDFNDLDGDIQEDFTINWYINGTLNTSFANLTEISSQFTTKGEQWNCSIQLFDGENYSSWYFTSSTYILNTPPSIQDLGIQGGENTSQNISLIYTFIDVDDDSEDKPKFIINWYYINGSVISGQNTENLSYISFKAGDILYAQITPNDGEEPGSMYQTDYFQIGNAIPEIIGVPRILGVNESSIYIASTPLSVNYTAEDRDHPLFIYDIEVDGNGLVVGSSYRWYRNGIIVEELTGSTVSVDYLVKGDYWIVSVRPRDRYGDYGYWVNSSQIIIGNTPPNILTLEWSQGSPTVQNDLSFAYSYTDHDADTEWLNSTRIFWYKNGTEVIEARNQTFLSKELLSRGDIINFSLSVFDGTNYSLIQYSTSITIVNAIPEAQNIVVLPNDPYTDDKLQISWEFVDYDNDNQSNAWMIKWYRNGLLVDELTNKTEVNSSSTSADEVWIVYLKVFDSIDYSQEYILPPAIILNTAPITLDISLINGLNVTYADSSLTLNLNDDIIIYDPDQDPIVSYSILWIRNYESEETFINSETIPQSELSKGDIWFVIVRVYDGKDWSANQSSQEIMVINKAPEISNLQFTDTIFSEFLLESEAIQLSYAFQDVDGDIDSSVVRWYQNQIHLSQYDNLSRIPANATSYGDTWYVEVQPYDNEIFGTQMNLTIIIESQPTIEEIGIEIISDREGHYTFWVNVTDPRNPITEVQFQFSIENITIEPTKWAEMNGSLWTLDYELTNYTNLGKLMRIDVTVISKVDYSTEFEITVQKYIEFTTEDKVAPRVVNAYFEKDDEINPQTLTFYAEIEEYGSTINDVILYYYFKPVNEGSGARISEWKASFMIYQNQSEINGNEIWVSTIEFLHNKSDLEIIYYISTSDSHGNENPTAFDIRNFPQRISENRFIFSPQGLPEWIVPLSILTVLCVLIGSISYIKFIRKPELVGLDKGLVMKGINKITEEEIINSLDLHSLGIVISYFDQRSGPLPLIVIPDLLQDNIPPLISLSDRSFNSCGFVDDFTSKLYSSFDYSLESLIRINSMSYSYSIENPEARGGADNYTANILIIPEIFPLISQFKEELQSAVHKIHMLMTNEPDNKEGILESVIELRNLVSYIVLSYKEIYKTTDLIEEV